MNQKEVSVTVLSYGQTWHKYLYDVYSLLCVCILYV